MHGYTRTMTRWIHLMAALTAVAAMMFTGVAAEASPRRRC